jgi:hypothetical protein
MISWWKVTEAETREQFEIAEGGERPPLEAGTRRLVKTVTV